MDSATGKLRTLSIEIELELDYEGLTDNEILKRCYEDEETITAAILSGERPVLPSCVKAFRLVDRGGGIFFPSRSDSS